MGRQKYTDTRDTYSSRRSWSMPSVDNKFYQCASRQLNVLRLELHAVRLRLPRSSRPHHLLTRPSMTCRCGGEALLGDLNGARHLPLRHRRRKVPRLGDGILDGGAPALAAEAVLGRVGQTPADVVDLDERHLRQLGRDGAETGKVAELDGEGGVGGELAWEWVAGAVVGDVAVGREGRHGPVRDGCVGGSLTCFGVFGRVFVEQGAEGGNRRMDVRGDLVLRGTFDGDGDRHGSTLGPAVDGAAALDAQSQVRGWEGGVCSRHD